jgi:hypothetical protein
MGVSVEGTCRSRGSLVRDKPPDFLQNMAPTLPPQDFIALSLLRSGADTFIAPSAQ